MCIDYEDSENYSNLEEELKEIRELGFIYPMNPKILYGESEIDIPKSSNLDLITLKRNARGNNTEYFYRNIYELIKVNKVTNEDKIFRFIEIITDNFRYQTWELKKEVWEKLVFELGFPENIPEELLPLQEKKEVDEYKGGVHERVKDSIHETLKK